MAKRKNKEWQSDQARANLSLGFMPCFSHYLYNKFPLEAFYQNETFVGKVSKILQELPTCANPIVDLKERTGCQDLFQVTPDSHEGKRIIAMCSWNEGKIYRLDFGKNKMRVIMGLYDNNGKRHCLFFGLDASHDTYPIGKTVR